MAIYSGFTHKTWWFYVSSPEGTMSQVQMPPASNLRGHLGSSSIWWRQSFSSNSTGESSASPCGWNSLRRNQRRRLGCNVGPSRIWWRKCCCSRSSQILDLKWDTRPTRSDGCCSQCSKMKSNPVLNNTVQYLFNDNYLRHLATSCD